MMSFVDRLHRTTAALSAAQVDALVLTPGADLFYLTGFDHGHAAERLLAFILRPDGAGSWIAPQMNVPQIESCVPTDQAIFGWSDADGYEPLLAQLLTGVRRVAFDDEARSAFLLDLVNALPQVNFVRASTTTRSLRISKDVAELSLLRDEARTVDDTIETAMGFCKPGRSETETDELLREALGARGPRSAVAFTIIAGGPNAALPHHETGQRRFRSGDLVILDYGTRGFLNGSGRFGYQSDITVTCSIGEPADAEAKHVYRAVWEAQQAALAAIRPGVTCETIDRAARTVIERSGYGKFFAHRTGHGIGLQGHEPPYLRMGNAEILETGMTFSIEPGIYLPGRFGVRLEVIACVTETGSELLNAPSRRELPIIG